MKSELSAKEIIRRFLKEGGHDGLCEPELGCGCAIDDFCPCYDGLLSTCVVAVNIGPKNGEDEWFEPLIQEWPGVGR